MQSSRVLKLKWVVVANFLNSTGASFLWPLTTVYMHDYLHESLATAGVVLFFMSCAMIAGNYLGGWLFDHWDPYKTAVLGVSVATVAVIFLIFFHSWPIFAILLMLVGFGDGVNVTVINAYAASIKGHKIRYIFNVLYMALNLGVVVGTLLVGFLMSYGVTLVFSVTSVSYVVFWLVTVLTFNVTIPKRNRKLENIKEARTKATRKTSTLVWLICMLVISAYLSYTLWESVMAVHLTNMHIPFYAYSLLWTMNGLIILVGQPLVNKFEVYLKIDHQIEIGVAIFALSFFLLIFADSLLWFAIDFVILTIGEMMGLPSIPAWIDQLTNPNQAGKYQGLMNMSISVGRAIGPLYGGMIIDGFGYPTLFLSVTVLMGLCLLAVMRNVWHVRKNRG
ncbi:MDR family MFS transporter [Paucilactobacillus wasatchensis]|uniref:Major facilitator superfamily permease n=1 Tax=Paucilactobacillus wasatchensis TaxID=1335616 RepID=A0A0D1A7C8_9LACO|nr:MFS transporter [Paucilactobacillus wasatchensis]KIS02596.1 Major facilitator superfamily permease [Paucilactobacillus wasatchensis]